MTVVDGALFVSAKMVLATWLVIRGTDLTNANRFQSAIDALVILWFSTMAETRSGKASRFVKTNTLTVTSVIQTM